MKTLKTIREHLLLVISMFFIIGCSNENYPEFNISPDEVSLNAIIAVEKGKENIFSASLKGSNEIPSVNTKASGEAIVRISKEGNSISYKLIASNLKNVRAAHFHMATDDANGPVVAFLFSGEREIQNGLLSEGTIMAEDVIGPLAGKGLEALIDNIRNGKIYVNVHTSDYPSGAIRGQL